MEESKKIYNIQFIIFAAVALCYLVIALTVGFCLDYDSVVYASILCLPFPLLCGWINYHTGNVIVAMGKQRLNKKSIIVSSVFLYIGNYLLLVLPLLIGTLVNLWTSHNIFELFTLLAGVMQFPVIRTLIRLGYSARCSIINNKVNK